MPVGGEAFSETARDGSAADAEQLRAWHERGESQHILTFLEPRTATEQSPLALFYLSTALVDRGREVEARHFVNEGLQRAGTDDLRADFLALLAFTEARSGDFPGYLAGARNAVQLRPTPLTLYHLGLASDGPEEGLNALRAALEAAEAQGERHAAARNAAAMAVPLLRLGRYREARHWLRYGEQRCRHEGLRKALLHTRAHVQVFLGEAEGLEAELRDVLSDHLARYPWLKEPISSVLADLLQAEGRYQEALAIHHDWLADAPRSVWPRVALGAVRALVALEQREDATALAETAVTVAGESSAGRAVARLALGIALWPAPTAEPHLQEALGALSAVVPLASEAALHLAALHERAGDRSRAVEVLSPLRPSLRELGGSGLKLLGGGALDAAKPLLREPPRYEVCLLGRTVVSRGGEPVRVRPRGLEILALLLAHPEGLTSASLSDAIYGREDSAALRVELYRLKESIGIELATSPYRLVTELTADVRAVDDLLRRGLVQEAVRLYRGPLLPQSQSLGVVTLREALETQVVEAALVSGDLEAIWALAQVVTDELRLWEALLRLPADDPRLHAVIGRVAWLRRDLEL